MAGQTYRISGSVIHQTTGQGVAGLRVEAWDKDLIFDDLVGSAVTDAQGKFQIEFTESHFRGIFFDRRPDLFFKVFKGGHLIKTTEGSVLWNVNTPYQEVTIEVDVATGGQPSPPKPQLKGILMIQAGVPPEADARLTAWIVSFDDPIGTKLGDHIVASKSIEWSIDFDFTTVAGPGASLQSFRPHLRFEVVRSLLGGGEKKHELLRFNADLSQRFTLILPDSYYPEIERVERALQRLAVPGTSEEDAVRHQIVAAEEGVPEEAFKVFEQAQAEAALTGLPLEIAYAFVRVRALAKKPSLPDDEALLRFAIERGYVGDEVMNPESLEEVRAWREREAEAAEKAERDRLAEEQAKQEQERRDAEEAEEETKKQEQRDRERRANQAAERLLRQGSGTLSALGEILKYVNLPEEEQLAYARILLDGRGASDEEVDKRLESAKISEKHRDTIRRVRGLMELIGDHPPLFKHAWQALPNARNWDPKKPDLSAFAQRTAERWQQILVEEKIDPPDNIRGKEPKDCLLAYARTLELQFDRLYPGEAIATRLTGMPVLEAFGDLLKRPDFDLRTQSIPADFLRSQAKEAVQDLRRFQRLVRLAPASEAGRLFANLKVSSAAEIAAMSSAMFIKRAKEAGIDETRAHEIHHQATRRSAEALALIANMAPGLHVGKPGAVLTPMPGSGSEEPSDTSATMTMLFGSEGACAVKECQSVLGMPAYFFDLLEEVRHNGSSVNLLDDILFVRRPDLGEIELSCENSEKRLPYVDLVNEILERAVVEKSNTAPFPQTTWEEDDLAASPEHLDSEAYDKLRVADYPWSLPFSLAHEEARTYLAHLGTSLFRLMELLNPPNCDDTSDSGAPKLAGEYLGLTSREVEYFATMPQLQPEAPFWGFEQNRTIGWSGMKIRKVEKFIKCSGVSWLELLDLILSDYINPGHALHAFTDSNQATAGAPVRIRLGKDPCNLLQTKLVGLQTGFLRRFRLFVRLWRRLGWPVRELDHAISIFGGNLTRACFLHLANVQRLRDSLQPSVQSILSLYGDIDVQVRWDRPESPSSRQPSQFERLFLDKSALAEPQRKPFERVLNPVPGEQQELLSAHTGSIRAVLGLSDADFQLLTDAVTFAEMIGEQPIASQKEDPDWKVFAKEDTLTVANLSRLFRTSTLARALNLSIPELLRFRAITGIDPFLGPYETLAFSLALERQRDAGFTVAELDYLLRDHGSVSDVVAGARDRARDRLKGQLTGNLSEEKAILIIAKHFQVPTPVITTLFGTPSISEMLGKRQDDKALITAITTEDCYKLLEKAVYVISKLRLTTDEVSRPEGDRLRPCAAFDWEQLVKPPLEGPQQNWLRFTAWRAFVDLVHVGDRLAAQNVSLWQVREAARKAAEEPATGTGDVVSASWHAASTLLGAAPADLLALTSIQAHVLNGTQWRRVIDALELVRTLGVSVKTAKAWVSNGIAATGTGSAEETQPWLILDEALQIRNAARARHDAQSWKEVARGLRDQLREKQRKTLVAYLCARDPAAPTAKTLYEKYLVDVEMGTQHDTTRIELAIASVQLFIQRVLLGLEKKDEETSHAFNAEFASRWEWMKRYESWANSRRVFLYPENYLRPDLRSDKSPQFVEAEEALAQRELKKENIEEIVANYVQKLDEIARLEVVGTCMEERKDSEGMLYRLPALHIVARTNGQPQVYYHRTWDSDTGHFTAWKKIDLSIDGEWVFPIVRDGRLTLYWIRHEKDMEGLKDSVGLTSAQPFPLQPHFPMFQDQYRLSWSTFYRGKWTPKKTAEQLIARPFLPFTETKFAVRVVGDRVRISGLTVMQTDIAKIANI